jgi:hypothetical protein
MKRLHCKHVLLGSLLATLAACSGSGSGSNAGSASAEETAPPPDNSPVVHSQIAAHPPGDCGGGFWSVHYEDAYKTLREAEDYKRGERDYYVRELSDRRNEYLLASISPKFRKDWLKSHNIPDKDAHCIVPLFDEIGAAAKRTLKNYWPAGYKYHEASDETLIKDAVKEKIPDAEIFRVGVKQSSWDIDKLSNGLPEDRYKYGMAWVKSATFDDGYCRIVHVNIIQDYSGAGTYADSKSRYINMVPAGCR